MARTIKKHCQTCETETSHWLDSQECAECASREGMERLQATQNAENQRKKASKKKKLSAKRKKAAKKAAATRELTAQAKAKQEMYRREAARRHLLPFLSRYEEQYKAGWVHKVIAAKLEQFLQDVIDEKSPRLMIAMPPRHGKSLLASQYFPAWALGKYPHLEFINCSYAQSLQMDFSRKIQELVKEEDYHLIFGNLGVTKKNEAIERWSLYDYDKGKRTGGGILAAGVGGPITGRGAHVLLIDDPVKNREEAESSTVREGAKSWYSSTAYTRLAPGGGVLVIQTRWHDDDLSGHLLTEMREASIEFRDTGEWPDDADRWDVVEFPAIATSDEQYRLRGEPLHPARYPLPALLKIKRTTAPRDWAALYQQNPQVEEGAYFQKKYFKMYKTAPAYMDIYAAGDLAISKKEHADWSVFYVAGVDEQNNVYMLDEYRGRWDAAEIIDVMFEIHKKWKPRGFGLEKGQISLTLDSFLNQRKREEGYIDLHIEELPPGKQDKELRGRMIQGLMSLGMVWWPEGALWVDDAINELLRFPNGVKDDRVDAAAWIGKMVSGKQYVGAGRPKDKRNKSWKKKLSNYLQGNKPGKKPHMAA